MKINQFTKEIFFLKNHTQKCGREASSRPFYKKSKLSVFLDQQSEMLRSLFFIVCPSRDLSK